MSSSSGFGAVRPQSGFNINQFSAGALDAAGRATQAGLGYRPAEISAQSYDPRGYNAATYNAATYDPSQYQAAQVAGQDLNPYLNPYTSNVIDNSMRQLGEAQSASLNQQGAQASAAGAFGGSRHGIADSATRLGYSQQAGDMASQMNLANYNNAMGLARGDVSAQNAANAANMAARNRAGEFNSGAMNTANQYNAGNLTAANKYAADQRASAQSQNVANQFNANSARMSAANQLGNLSQTGFNQSQAIQDMQLRQGALQQAQQQMIYDREKQNFMGYLNSPSTSLNTMIAAMAGQPNQSTTTNQNNPGLFNYLQTAAMGLSGLGGMGG